MSKKFIVIQKYGDELEVVKNTIEAQNLQGEFDISYMSKSIEVERALNGAAPGDQITLLTGNFYEDSLEGVKDHETLFESAKHFIPFIKEEYEHLTFNVLLLTSCTPYGERYFDDYFKKPERIGNKHYNEDLAHTVESIIKWHLK